MASSIQLLRSTNPQERPFAGNLLEGQPAANLHSSEPGLFFKTTDGSVVKFGPAAITSDGSPPNSTPQGSSGNSVGELWLDKSVDPAVLKVYDGAQWVDAGSGGGGSGSGAFVRWIYTAIGGETSLSGTSGGVLLDYTPGLEEVYVNGVLITRGVDYSATNGTSITNLAALTAGDVITVLSMNPIETVQLPGQVTLLRWSILASAGQTVLSGIDSFSQQLTYTTGYEEVYVNGAFLRRGIDYVATDGSTITGLSPLTLDDEITVLAWSPFTVGSQITNNDVAPDAGIASSKLSFFQSGSNAVQRSVESKLRDVINVKDFGAAGTGGDDTASFQAAIDKAVQLGKSLYVPHGTYVVNGISVSGGIKIFGDGAKESIISAGTAIGQGNIITFLNCVGVTILDCGFDGRNDVRTPILPPLSFNEGQFNLYFDGGSNIHIQRCEFIRGVNKLVQFNSSTVMESVTITDSRFEDSVNGGISIARNATKVNISCNFIKDIVNVSKGGTPFEKSISVSGSSHVLLEGNYILSTNGGGCSLIVEIPSSGAQTRCEAVVIRANRIEGSGENGIKAGSSDNVIISQNTILDSSSSGIRVEGSKDVLVDSNYVSGSGGNAVSIYEESYGVDPRSFRVSVVNNTFRNSNTGGFTLATPPPTVSFGQRESYHLWCRESVDVDIRENTFLDDSLTQAGGILLQLSGRFNVKNNNLLGMKTGSVALYSASALPANPFEVSGNSGMKTQDSGVITLSSGSSSATVTPNVITNSGAFISITPLSALSGSVAYTNVSLGSSPSFTIQTRGSSHSLTPVSSDTQFAWSLETSKPIGVFGLTSH